MANLKNCSIITTGSSLEGKCYSVINKTVWYGYTKMKKEKNHHAVQQYLKEAKLFLYEQNVTVVPRSVTTWEYKIKLC